MTQAFTSLMVETGLHNKKTNAFEIKLYFDKSWNWSTICRYKTSGTSIKNFIGFKNLWCFLGFLSKSFVGIFLDLDGEASFNYNLS